MVFAHDTLSLSVYLVLLHVHKSLTCTQHRYLVIYIATSYLVVLGVGTFESRKLIIIRTRIIFIPYSGVGTVEAR